ncbi:MAG: LysR family transcriptional regulator [Burkholderiaceae bacterium]
MHSLTDLVLFVEVARAGGFRHAALRLDMPPATLSRRIAAMEARLGTQLFQRTTRQVSLTEAARPFYEQCLTVLEAAQRAQGILAASQEQPARIRVSMPVDLGVEILGPLIAAFAAGQPGLRIEFDLSSRATDLLRDPVDLVFRIGRPMDDRVVARKVADITTGLYAAPAYLGTVNPITEPAHLAHLQCLDLQTAQGSMPWKVDHLRWPAAPGTSTLSANSVALLRTLAERGHGLALLPEHIASASVEERRLTRLLPRASTPRWPLYAMTATRLVSGQLRRLIEHVKGSLQATPLSKTTRRR